LGDGQSQFSPEAYRQYLQQTKPEFSGIAAAKIPATPLYSKLDVATYPKELAYSIPSSRSRA
jgi:hypothetical protein